MQSIQSSKMVVLADSRLMIRVPLYQPLPPHTSNIVLVPLAGYSRMIVQLFGCPCVDYSQDDSKLFDCPWVDYFQDMTLKYSSPWVDYSQDISLKYSCPWVIIPRIFQLSILAPGQWWAPLLKKLTTISLLVTGL